MRIFSYILAIILVLFGLTFALLNATPVNLNYYVGTTSLSLSLLLILTVGLGIIIGLIACIGPILKQKRKNYHLRQRIKQLEQEIVTTKVPAIKD